MSAAPDARLAAAGGLLERVSPPAGVSGAPARPRRLTHGRLGWWAGLAVVLLGGLGLRLWGIAQGLPFAYNVDENSHFVPYAVGMFGHSLDPGPVGHHYFANPPAFTYVLHAVFAVWFGGRAALAHTLASNPTEVYVVARVVTALLGVLAVGLLYGAGARLFDRRVGLLAAGLMAVAFLPVFYSHLALNDVPTLAPATLTLLGAAGVLRYGRPVDYLLAGVGLGLACATKYTGGIMLVPLLAAASVQFLAPGGERSAIVGMGVLASAALLAFLVANPYSVLDFAAFRDGINHQSSVSADGVGKLGTTQSSGLAYYLWTFTWGLGWVPAIAAVGGAIALWWDERRLVWVLVPAIVLYLAFMSLQSRYFGRWLLPAFPLVCLLAAYAVLEAADFAARRRPALRPTLVAVAVVALCGQGAVYSIHSGLILSRADTRNEARAWMVAHIPAGQHIVVEPVVPDSWVQDVGRPLSSTPNGNRWLKYSSLRSVADDGTPGSTVNIEDYERTLRPSLITLYEQKGFCWVISGSTQFGRALAQPGQVPNAIAYYRRLAQVGQVVYRASPYATGHAAVPFNFDWAFDFYPLAYQRPGPAMVIYHLTGGGCASTAGTGDVPAVTVAP